MSRGALLDPALWLYNSRYMAVLLRSELIISKEGEGGFIMTALHCYVYFGQQLSSDGTTWASVLFLKMKMIGAYFI